MNKCDVCKKKYSLVINFGRQSLANHYKITRSYEARVGFCYNCIILKCIHKIPNEKIFQKNYPYLSSLSSEFKKYLKNISEELKLRITKGNILEIGSNDGSFLKYFDNKDYNIIGLEPATSSHKIAKKMKINSINKYFDKKSSTFLREKYRSFDLIFSINTFAHIDKIKNNFNLVSKLLNKKNKKSIFVFENIDITSLVSKNNFPQLYDEHVYTMSANCVNNICKKNNLILFDIKKTNNQDGSLRYYIGHGNIKQKKIVKNVIRSERKFLNKVKIKMFSKKIINIKNKAKNFFNNNKKNIYGFGASAKATFIANYLSLNNKDLRFIFDNSPFKINKILPGTNIKIKKEISIRKVKNSTIFIFIPNHFNEIMKKYRNLSKKNNLNFISLNEI